MGAEGASDEDVITLGVEGKPFKFAEDSPSDVSCELCSVGPDGTAGDVRAVEAFIRRCFANASKK